MNTNLPPLAERMRPGTLEGYFGQSDLVRPGGPIHDMLQTGLLRSFILWGPPGVGKTTLARIVAKHFDLPFFTLSAVSSGVKEVRDVIKPVSYTHLTLPTTCTRCRCRWSPYH